MLEAQIEAVYKAMMEARETVDIHKEEARELSKDLNTLFRTEKRLNPAFDKESHLAKLATSWESDSGRAPRDTPDHEQENPD